MNDLLEIMDTMGSTRNVEIHPTEKIILYEIGNALMLWNLEYDKKVKLHTHYNRIGCFLFCGKGHKYILSVDVATRPTILLSDWTSLKKVCTKRIMKKTQETQNSKALFIERKKSIIIVENFKENLNSRLILCEIRNENLNILFNENQDLNDCLALHYFDYKMIATLVTIEKFCIKIWKIMQDKFLLENRIHSKEEISESFLNSERNLLYFVTNKNILNVMNQDGELMTKVRSSNLITSISGDDQHLFVSNLQGTVKKILMSTFSVLDEILLGKLKNIKNERFQRNISYQEELRTFNSCDKTPEYLSIIMTKASKSLLVVILSNGTLITYDLQRKKIISTNSGHFLKINQISQNPYNSNSFVTSSNDGTIQIWEFFENKWMSKIFDCSHLININVPNLIHENNEYSSNKLLPPSINEKTNYNPFKIKNFCFHPHKSLIYAANNNGYIMICDIKSQKILISKQIFSSKICNMSFYKNGEYLAVILSNGEAFLLNANNFFIVANIENQWLNKDQTSKYFKGIHILNDDESNSQLLRAERKISAISFDVISSNSSNKIRLQQIFKINEIYNATVLVNYSVEAPYEYFVVHPSNEYVLILLSIGLICVFKIKTGELRGKIQIPKFSNRFSIDPSGLYLAVSCPSLLKRIQQERLDESMVSSLSENLLKNHSLISELTDINSIQKDSYIYKIIFYEIGTGKYVGEVDNLNTITKHQFSLDGNFLISGTNNGFLYVWNINDEIFKNIHSMLNAMKIDDNFWKNYPIYLEEPKIPSEEKIVNNFHLTNEGVNPLIKKDKRVSQESSGFKERMTQKKILDVLKNQKTDRKEIKDEKKSFEKNSTERNPKIQEKTKEIIPVLNTQNNIMPDPKDLHDDVSAMHSQDFAKSEKRSKVRSIQFSPFAKRSESYHKF